MFIKDLQPRQTKVDVQAEILEVGPAREFSKGTSQGRVATAFIKDGTGKVKLSLWNDQIDKVKVGDLITVINGYVNEYQGEMQLTTGKFGTIEVLENKEETLTEDNKEEADVFTGLNQSHDNDDEALTEDEQLISDAEDGGSKVKSMQEKKLDAPSNKTESTNTSSESLLDVEEEDFT